jgi:hypothetical protein
MIGLSPLNLLSAVIGSALLVAAYRLREKRGDFWVLLISGLAAVFWLLPFIIPFSMRRWIPIRTGPVAFYASGLLLIIWGFLTKLGGVARFAYIACGLVFLLPVIVMAVIAALFMLHGA